MRSPTGGETGAKTREVQGEFKAYRDEIRDPRSVPHLADVGRDKGRACRRVRWLFIVLFVKPGRNFRDQSFDELAPRGRGNRAPISLSSMRAQAQLNYTRRRR